jgi:hypothetical protein
MGRSPAPAAVEQGIVPGGGVALLRAKAAFSKLKSPVADVQAGINIVLKALESPIRQIVENAGVEGSIVVGKISENSSETHGFNAQTEQYVDMISAGIVDPAKVVRTALQDAASVAGLLITTEAMVAEVPRTNPPCRWAVAAAWAAWISEVQLFLPTALKTKQHPRERSRGCCCCGEVWNRRVAAMLRQGPAPLHLNSSIRCLYGHRPPSRLVRGRFGC